MKQNGCSKGSGLSFREREEHHTCFYDASFPCPWCAGGIGNERHRKGCAIIKITELTQLPTYPLMTGSFSVREKLDESQGFLYA